MELKSPTPKRAANHLTKTAPLPVFFDNDGILDEYSSVTQFSGYFNGDSVIVDNPEEMKALYTMGFFGKASLSKGFPNFGQHKKDEPLVLKESQWERRKEWEIKLDNIISAFPVKKNAEEPGCSHSPSSVLELSNSESLKSASVDDGMDTSEVNTLCGDDSTNVEIAEVKSESKIGTNEVNLSISEGHNFTESLSNESKEVLILSDCLDDDNLQNLNPHIEVEKFKTVVEILYLSLEDAFFLSFALGCLQVMDLTGKPLSIAQLWDLFICSQKDFIENYVTYHYFRAKGWVVKSGIKFGGQFLLYKQGPAFFHASYLVLVDSINSPNADGSNKSLLTWDKMNSLNRMAEACKKEIIVCKVQWPEMTDEEKENPLILKKFKVKEYLLRRWQPCHEKDTADS